MNSNSSSPVFDPALQQQLAKGGIIAVLVIDDARDAVPLARALLAGGVSAMELTLRTAAALDALRAIRAEVPEMLAGVGTILMPAQVREAVRARAVFGVAPGCNRRVIEAALAEGLSFAPGVCTPSDIEAALESGCRWLKFFPAEPSGGIKFLENMAAPYAHLDVRFVPLGGIGVATLPYYLASPLVSAVGGSWLAPRELIRAQALAQIATNAREARALIERLRAEKKTAVAVA